LADKGADPTLLWWWLWQTMLIMGLSGAAYNLSWYITMTLQVAVMSLAMTLVGSRSVFLYSDKYVGLGNSTKSLGSAYTK
jgi:hypothetical protein